MRLECIKNSYIRCIKNSLFVIDANRLFSYLQKIFSILQQNHTLPYRYGAERGIHTFHFIEKGGVILKPSDFQKTIQCQFDCKLKKVVKGIVRNHLKELARRQAKEVSFCELPEIVVEKLIVLLAYHVRSEIMAKDPIKKADNGTYYFRANLGYNPITGKQIQKYRSGFRTKKETKEEYSKLVLASTEELTTKKKMAFSFSAIYRRNLPAMV